MKFCSHLRKLQSDLNIFELWTEVETKCAIALHFHRSSSQNFSNLCHKEKNERFNNKEIFDKIYGCIC